MSEQIWFIETSVSAPVLLPSLAPASTVMERGNPKGTRAKVRCLPWFHQILDSRVAAHRSSRHCAVTTTKHITCVAETRPACSKHQMFGDCGEAMAGVGVCGCVWGGWLHNLLGNILLNIW